MRNGLLNLQPVVLFKGPVCANSEAVYPRRVAEKQDSALYKWEKKDWRNLRAIHGLSDGGIDQVASGGLFELALSVAGALDITDKISAAQNCRQTS